MAALALRPADLREFDGERRVMDVRLGEVLGMAQPLNIRKVIQKNETELAAHGSIHAARELIEHGKGGRREVTIYHLNEAQALLICMFSRAPNAAAARTQIIEVYMAYRHGQLTSATDQDHRWAMLERRLDQVERLLAAQEVAETHEYAVAITYAPPVFRLTHPNGELRGQRYPKFWDDLPVRQTLIRLHRQTTISRASAAVAGEFGQQRAPSKSAIQRFWKNLDLTRAAK